METHLFWGQKVKDQGHESQKQCWVLHSCERWLLLVQSAFLSAVSPGWVGAPQQNPRDILIETGFYSPDDLSVLYPPTTIKYGQYVRVTCRRKTRSTPCVS